MRQRRFATTRLVIPVSPKAKTGTHKHLMVMVSHWADAAMRLL